MQVPISDTDFYERKITRLQSDIASLHTELNNARTRLRSAEDYQIKYELLLRQSNQQNARLKMIEQVQRNKFTALLEEEIQAIKQSCQKQINERQASIREDYENEIKELNEYIGQLKEKNKETSEKADQVDSLLFQNKKIAKQLEYLEEIINENKEHNERQKQEELKAMKDHLTKKFNEKSQQEKIYYQKKITNLEEQCQSLNEELEEARALTSRYEKAATLKESPQKSQEKILEELQNYRKQLEYKNDEIDKILTDRIKNEKMLMEETKSLKQYINELEGKVFELENNQSAELLNLKNRMESIREQEMTNFSNSLSEKLELMEKQKIKLEFELDEALTNNRELHDKLDKETERHHQKSQQMHAKICDLQDKLRDHEHQQEIGETQNLIHSLRQFDFKEDENTNYQNGVTFLSRKLKLEAMKNEKKNYQIQGLVTELNEVRADCEKEIVELKEKYYQESKLLEKKIYDLEEQLADANDKIRERERYHQQKQSELTRHLNKMQTQMRGLRNLNNEMQRDYNRVLESKKNIEKSYREERERSVTSKSEIAVAKQQKWLDLQRQKNDVELIYKEKEEQLKMKATLELEQIRVERDKLQQQLELLREELEQVKRQGGTTDDKENFGSEYHKKLAAINLEIGLTENLYKAIIESKSRNKIQFLEEQKGDKSEQSDIKKDWQLHQFKFGSNNESEVSEIKEEKQDIKEGIKEDNKEQDEIHTPYFSNNMMMSFKPNN